MPKDAFTNTASRRAGRLLCLLPLFFLCMLQLMTVPPAVADDWGRWKMYRPSSIERIDHREWQAFLDAYVRPVSDGINRVRYRSVSDADRNRLKEYVRMLAGVAVSDLARDEQLAYWVNLYNAVTVDVVLDHYPVDSIRQIGSGLFTRGPWTRKLVQVEGQSLSLDDIEHRIVRPLWADPRLHYVFNCASLGCPNLPLRALSGEGVAEALEQAAREFVNHPRGVSLTSGRLVVSSIYHWYEVDFGGSQRGVIEHLRRYAGPELAPLLSKVERVSNHQYDWALNDFVE